ncbi:MAG: amylo-alpha-1,6-glucosidase [Dehalococcoidia bacterium]
MSDPKPAGGAAQPARRLLPEAEPMDVQDIRDALVIRERDLFLLTDKTGEVPADNINGHGLYFADTRYLSTFEFSLAENKSMVLLSTAELGYSSEHVLTNYALTDLDGRKIPRATVQVHRTRVVEDALEETLRVDNYNNFPVHLDLQFRFAGDFADIFVVRGFAPEPGGEAARPAIWNGESLQISYRGTDDRSRNTTIRFAPKPWSVETAGATAQVTFRELVAARGHTHLSLVIAVDGRVEVPRGASRFAIVAEEYDTWKRESTQIESDNSFFDTVLQRSLSDVRMLWNHGSPGGYPAAGTPWYDALFGRDTAIVGLQTLCLKPSVARACLVALSRWQGQKFDTWRDEEPGKILHELRVGEMTQSGALPFSPYFGSIDSTPLFLLLAGEYFQWTNDVELLSQIEPNLRAGLQWLTDYGDTNRDGLIDYEKRSSKGLVNQGWKDSWDALMHADGSPLAPPITLVEVQAYAYAALDKLAPVFAALGDAETARDLVRQAAALQERFNRKMWTPDGFYAMALDGEGRQAASIASNAGHALWGGIATFEQARPVVQRMMEPDMFSGWGIRTLSSKSPCFNPQGYHVGTVWPHDNSIIAMGFKRYGFERELNRLATALFDAARAFPYYRLPELFGGMARSGHDSPVPYPVACQPQAWAAGAFPLVTQAMLGLSPDSPNARLRIVRPILPDWLRYVRVRSLRVGTGAVDLFFERRGANTSVVIDGIRGHLDVAFTDEWPLRSASPVTEPDA